MIANYLTVFYYLQARTIVLIRNRSQKCSIIKKEKLIDLLLFYSSIIDLNQVMKSTKTDNEHVPSDDQNNIRNPSNSNKSFSDKKIKHKYSNKQSQIQFSEFFTMFQQFISNNQKQNLTARLASKYDLEVRDREVIVQPPSIINKKIDHTQLKKWISKVMRTVSSAAFHYFQNNQMTFEQAKVYYSENILKNIVILGQSATLTDKDFEAMDKHIKTKVIDYLSAKYPMTDSAEVNKKLEETVRQVDNIESPQNNYFNNTDLVFEYRDDGNYNDLIMRMMNEIIGVADEQSGGEKTNYEDFRQFMANLFEKVEDQDWARNQDKEQISKESSGVHQKQNIFSQQTQIMDIKGGIDLKKYLRNKNEEKDRYRAQVKEYTNYLIGRKVCEDTPQYSEKQIQSKNIDVKRPAVLRILTKLCEGLLQKFQSENYYSDRPQNIALHRGGISLLTKQGRKQLDQYLLEEKEEIDKYMKELSDSNYQMHQNLLKHQMRYMNQGDQQIDEQQKISAKFSLKVVKNLHSQIISLLNRLIHGLMKVAKRYHDANRLLSCFNCYTPPNLLSFTVGDLMRCKCSSHQKQILMIYKEIQRLSREQPQKLRIVRIKNRLRTGTNDILINVKFNGKVMCEIQLAVKATTSNFIKCSNEFHHYLYELKRSYFGPLTELCSIWSCLDQRRQIYQQIIDAQDQLFEHNEHICAKLNQPYEMLRYTRPFICGQCSRTYFHNNYIRSHSRCSQCDFFVCYKCQLSQMSEKQLIYSLITDQKLRNICVKKITKTQPLPQLGVCVFMESQSSKAEKFFHFVSQKKKKQYIFSKMDDKIFQIELIGTKKQEQYFRDKYTIFKIKPSSSFSIKKEQIQKKYKYINLRWNSLKY